MASMTLSIDEQNMKRLLKEALLELLEERQDLFLEVMSEVIEEAGMVHAIKEGEDTEYVTREDVDAVLRETS
jgi:Asp-tRNA(Asn)/Glu-tRNA(Gln) amidotransferase C subunit